jgi:dinuclear metal center YbgI/SA1388 family protein
MTIGEVLDCLEAWAPPTLQASYDNAGLLTGSRNWQAAGALLTLDCTEAVIEEAMANNLNLIIAHHPIIFKGLKSVTEKTYAGRAVIKAVKNDIAIYAIHTNLDHIATGVCSRMADKLGLTGWRVLLPLKNSLEKITTFIPVADTDRVLLAVHQAGAGNIGNYSHCSFRVTGTGTFLPGPEASPAIGRRGTPEHVTENRVEVILPAHARNRVLAALKSAHPYEEVAYYLHALENDSQETGSGLVGELPNPMPAPAFLQTVKTVFGAGCVRHTALVKPVVKRVALCGGAGSFLLPRAIAAGADVFISADFKYHEFFDAEDQIIVADIGHYESEQFTKELIGDALREKFPTFALNFSKTITNPISYL